MKSRFLPLLAAALLGGAAANAQCTNLVSNPNADQGLTDWDPLYYNTYDAYDGSVNCFVYYHYDTLTQSIDLTNTLNGTQLASKPTINFSQQFKVYSVYGCNSADYKIVVTLEDANHNALQTWTTGNNTTTSTSAWETIQHSFVNYSGTPQFVRIQNGGSYCTSQGPFNEGLCFRDVEVNALVTTLTADSTIAQGLQGINSTISYDDPATCYQTGVVLSTTTSDLGSTTVRTMLDNTVKTYNGQPYLPRHFEIAPTTQDTATVTLYIDQADFDAYNAVRGSFLPLPDSGDVSDPALANLSISAFHGTPSGGFDPGNYSGSREIIPNSAITKVWNADANRWEFTFSIDHFSGFFIAGGMTVLPIAMGDVNLNTRNGKHILNWNTYTEGRNDYFVIERSADGRVFTAIGKVEATGHAGAYAYTDANTPAGLSYYRIKTVDGVNGQMAYSNIVTGRMSGTSVDVVTVAPNPASGTLNVRVNGTDATGTISLSDAAGKEVKHMDISGTAMKMDISGVPAGLYFLSARTNGQVQTIKVTVQ
jgi:hypothetical protein